GVAVPRRRLSPGPGAGRRRGRAEDRARPPALRHRLNPTASGVRVRAVQRRSVHRLQAAMDLGQRLLKITQLSEHGRERLRRRRLLVPLMLQLREESRDLPAQTVDLQPEPLAIRLGPGQTRVETFAILEGTRYPSSQ